MPWTSCRDCGEPFYREDEETWKTRCFPCWKHKKIGTSIHEDRIEKLEQENKFLKNHIIHLENENSEYQEDLAKIFKYIGFMIFACHPDRVPGREQVAHEVMIWLNAKRNQFRDNNG